MPRFFRIRKFMMVVTVDKACIVFDLKTGVIILAVINMVKKLKDKSYLNLDLRLGVFLE